MVEFGSRGETRRVALVTGAAQGIGLGIARFLVEAGYRVAMGDVEAGLARASAEELKAVETDGEACALNLDVTDSEDWRRAIAEVRERWMVLDVLVNCAGISPRGTLESTDEELWDRTLAVNLKGAWLGIKAALTMLRHRRGTVINIGSTRCTRPMPGLFSYVVSKAGLWGLTRQVAVEFLNEGITCNMIAPGWVDTPNERMIQVRHGFPDFPEGIRNLTTPEEIGAAVLYLASPAAKKINGVVLYLDAGLHIADDAGMVYLIDRNRPPFEQRIEKT